MATYAKTPHFQLRAWDSVNNRMIYDHKEVVMALYVNAPEYIFMQWIGHFDDSPEKRKIFMGDICDIEILNDFGSASKYRAIVAFNAEKAQFSYDIFDSTGTLFPGQKMGKTIVVGTQYENPERLNKKD